MPRSLGREGRDEGRGAQSRCCSAAFRHAAAVAALFGAVAALAPTTLVSAASAADAAAGRRKAVQCQTCHGLDGLSKLPEAPNLAGQPEEYLVKSLNDYRTGERKNEMMSIVAPALSDADVADLAAYYASIKITVQAP